MIQNEWFTEEIRKSSNKRYEELTISDEFMFFAVMQNEELCKRMLETILDIKIEKIEYLEVEKQIKELYEGRGIRLDVYLKDTKRTVYNLEMQVKKQDNIPRRMRYYQGIMDVNLLKESQAYEGLNDSYVIFLCRFDLFGKNKAKYTFKNTCKEVAGLELGDGATKVVVNSKAVVKGIDTKELEVSEELVSLLKYIEKGEVTDEFTTILDKEVGKVKNDSSRREQFMFYEIKMREHDLEIEREAEKRGKAIGQARTADLYVKLIDDGRFEDARRAKEDEEYLQQLLKEYSLI